MLIYIISMGMKILSIDQSYTHCAYCVMEDDNLIDYGIIKTDKEHSIYDRALSVSVKLGNIYTKHLPTVVKIEGLAFGMRGNATRDLAGLLFTIITYMKHNYGFDNFQIISPKTVKKIATESGKATKKEMIAALPSQIRDLFLQQNYKLTTGLADLADAFWIAKC